MKSWLKGNWPFLAVAMAYWVSRIPALVKLPVFADEAIYIRWAQMIANEPLKYMFLPMYDGKPPLQMWLMIPFLALNRLDPLCSARIMSVTAGFIAMIMIVLIIKTLGGKRLAQLFGALLYLTLPFTFFHDRMALIDPLFLMWLTLTFLGLLKIRQTGQIKWTILTGVFFGAALLTKTPALWFPLIFPFVWYLLPPKLNKVQLTRGGLLYAGVGLIGIAMFLLLKTSELFPFLLNRSGDFSFSLGQVIGGEWRRSLINLTNYGRFAGWYITWPLLLVIGLGTLLPQQLISGKRFKYLPLTLVLLAIILATPFILMGKIVFSRYYLPGLIFLIPAASIAIEKLVKGKYLLLAWILGGLIIFQGIWFIYPWYTNLSNVHLPPEDIKQYLTEWSAGFGNREVADFIKDEAANKQLAVATEGFFGTLPDGLSIYFDHSPLNENVSIFGVGQPISGLTPAIREKALIVDTYIVVNEHRLSFNSETCCTIVDRYHRPLGGPDLLLLKVKNP